MVKAVLTDMGIQFPQKFNLKFLGVLTSILVLYVGFRLILLHGFGIKI